MDDEEDASKFSIQSIFAEMFFVSKSPVKIFLTPSLSKLNSSSITSVLSRLSKLTNLSSMFYEFSDLPSSFTSSHPSLNLLCISNIANFFITNSPYDLAPLKIHLNFYRLTQNFILTRCWDIFAAGKKSGVSYWCYSLTADNLILFSLTTAIVQRSKKKEINTNS